MQQHHYSNIIDYIQFSFCISYRLICEASSAHCLLKPSLARFVEFQSSPTELEKWMEWDIKKNHKTLNGAPPLSDAKVFSHKSRNVLGVWGICFDAIRVKADQFSQGFAAFFISVIDHLNVALGRQMEGLRSATLESSNFFLKKNQYCNKTM